MSFSCFDCGDIGHVAADCPNHEMASGNKPPWCGICDQQTRLTIVADGRAARCPECHPKRREHLKQHRRCPSCKMLVHDWDTNPCGRHSSPVARDHRPPIDKIREITRAGKGTP